MKIKEKFYVLKERRISLDKTEIVDACIKLINNKFPARDMQECTETDWNFYSEEGDITDIIEEFVFIESFKKDYI